MRTQLLDIARWDVILDAAGNVAIADEPYAIAQDVASAAKLFRGELFYNTALGIPYFREILGYFPPAQIYKSYLINAALTVPNVVSAVVFFNGLNDRVLTGQILVTDKSGVTSIAGF